MPIGVWIAGVLSKAIMPPVFENANDKTRWARDLQVGRNAATHGFTARRVGDAKRGLVSDCGLAMNKDGGVPAPRRAQRRCS